MPEQPKSRLDREIDEILAKKAKEPIDINQRRRERATNVESKWKATARNVWRYIASSPLLIAYVLAGFALLINPVVHFVAVLLCLASVAALWLPGVLRLTRSNGGGKTEVKYWRGQAYASEIKSAGSRSPIESLKRYFDARR